MTVYLPCLPGVDDPSANQARGTYVNARTPVNRIRRFHAISCPNNGDDEETDANPALGADQVDEGPEPDGGR